MAIISGIVETKIVPVFKQGLKLLNLIAILGSQLSKDVGDSQVTIENGIASCG